MESEFLQTRGGAFALEGEEVVLRGFSLGSWMNFEHFMLRIPGTEKRIRDVFAEVYGSQNAKAFFDDLLLNFIGEEDIRFLRKLGVNALRIPLNYRHFESDQAPRHYLEEGFRHLDRVVGLCRRHGILAILDMHTAPGGQNPDSHSGGGTGVAMFWEDAAARRRIVDIWRAIAARYADNTAVGGYDLLNEPAFVSDRAAFNGFYDEAVRAIRSVDGNHIIFIEGDDWAKDFELFDRLGGPQQSISFHFYPGQQVCLCADRESRNEELERRISYFVKLRDRTGLPLWVGETGGRFPKNRLGEGLCLVRDCLEIFERNRISWTVWTYKDARAMGLVYPREDTNWMRLGNELRPRWQLGDRKDDVVSREVLGVLGERFSYEIGPKDLERHSFRISALLWELHMEYLYKPRIKTIPWEEMREYPKAFSFENCEIQQEAAEVYGSFMK